MARVNGGGAADGPFYTADGETRAVRFDPTAGVRSRRREAGGRGKFPAQVQVFGPGTREGGAAAKVDRAKNGLGRKMSDGPNLIGIFSGD